MVAARRDSSGTERNWNGGTFFKNETTVSVMTELDDATAGPH
jgi:hypothetical protein